MLKGKFKVIWWLSGILCLLSMGNEVMPLKAAAATIQRTGVRRFTPQQGGTVSVVVLYDDPSFAPNTSKLGGKPTTQAVDAPTEKSQKDQGMRLFPALQQRRTGTTQATTFNVVTIDDGDDTTEADTQLPVNMKGKDEPKKHGEFRSAGIAKYTKDARGNWLFNRRTAGDIFVDNRNRDVVAHTSPRLKLNSKPEVNYYIFKTNYSPVCAGLSTIYNKPRISKWLVHAFYQQKHRIRPMWSGIRRELYEIGHADECKDEQYDKFKSYIQCAIRRNQRLEFMIPQYPLKQIGYFANYMVTKRS